MQSVGKRLKAARKRRGLTQAALATLAHVKQPSISEIETGETKVVAGDTLLKLCGALRVRPQWLLLDLGAMDEGAESLPPDEADLLEKYRQASPRWKIAMRYLAGLQADKHQDEIAEGVNIMLAKVAADPVPDAKLGTAWTRPDKKHT